MNNPHDKFFKKSISKKETAKGFLEHYLPHDLLAKIDLNTLQIEKDSFADEELEEYLPDFKYILFDLSNYSKEEIKNTGQMKVFINVLSAVFQDDFEEKLYDAISVLKQLEEQDRSIDYFQTVVKYILEADAVDRDLEEVTKIVNRVSKERSEQVMSIAEKLREEEREKARKEKLEIAKNLLDMGMNIHQISEATELNEEQIKELKRKSQH